LSTYRRLLRIASEVVDSDEIGPETEKSVQSQSDSDDETSLIEANDDDEDDDGGEEKDTRIRARKPREVAPLSRLEKALLDFSLSLLDHISSRDEYDLPFIGALAVLGLDRNGFRGPDSYPSILSSILKISRFLVLRYSFEDSTTPNLDDDDDDDDESSTLSTPDRLFSGLDLGNGPLDRVKVLVDRFLIRGSNTPINWLLDLRNYGLKIARTSTSPGYIDWDGETILYGSISFSISNFRSFLHGLTSSTRDILFREILFENSTFTSDTPLRPIPDIPWEGIFDNPIDSTPFSNFLSDSRTDLGLQNPQKFLFTRIATSPDLASRFSLPGPGLTWNTRKLSDWISTIQLFLEKLLLLFHLGGGQPSRAPEILSIRFSNSIETGNRSIYLENGFVYFVTYYHKGYSISGSTKIIHRYLPREIGELLVYYLWLVLPFLTRISLEVSGKPPTDYLFQNLSRKPTSKARQISSNRFRTIFRRESLAGLGLALNPSEYRHIAIGISRRFLSKSFQFQPEDLPDFDDEKDVEYEDEVLDSILDRQAGHSPSTAGNVYARGIFEASGEVRGQKRLFQEASLVSLFFFIFSRLFNS